MDSPSSPFRVSVKMALMEIAVSVPVFWIVYQLGFGGPTPLMIGMAALYSARLWKKGFFGPVENRVSDAHIPIISPGHALSWFNILCLASWAAILHGADPSSVLRKVAFHGFLLALLVASYSAWRLYRSRKDTSSRS